MLSIRDIRRQMRSVSDTAQITKAMQMVAASRMRKAQEAALALRGFMQRLYRIQRNATTQTVDFTHPLMEVRPIRNRAVILVAADKGLCGGLNSNVFRLVSDLEDKSTTFITVGRKAAQFVARTRRELAADFPNGDAPRFSEARAIAVFARDLFLNGEVDQVQVVATRFVNTLRQDAVSFEFLPVGEIKGLTIEGAKSEDELQADASDFQFEPDPETVLGYLLPQYLNVYLYNVLLNAKASEHSARMVSMKNATENADQLIKDLKLEFNKQRQGNITKELLDIAGGQAGAD